MTWNGAQREGTRRVTGSSLASRRARTVLGATHGVTQNAYTFSMLTNMPLPVAMLVKRVPSLLESMVQPLGWIRKSVWMLPGASMDPNLVLTTRGSGGTAMANSTSS